MTFITNRFYSVNQDKGGRKNEKTDHQT
jgi:hypothetical protein